VAHYPESPRCPRWLYQNSVSCQSATASAWNYIVFLVVLLAVGGPEVPWLFKTLIVFGWP